MGILGDTNGMNVTAISPVRVTVTVLGVPTPLPGVADWARAKSLLHETVPPIVSRGMTPYMLSEDGGGVEEDVVPEFPLAFRLWNTPDCTAATTVDGQEQDVAAELDELRLQGPDPVATGPSVRTAIEAP